MRGNYQKVTPIDQLPELHQVDSEYQPEVQQPEYSTSTGQVHPKLNRFIRQNSPVVNETYDQDTGTNFQTADEAYSESLYGSRDLSRQYKPVQHPYKLSPPVMSYMEPYESDHSHYNCRDLYGHVKECDICKRFYKTDNTVYLVIIAILLVACALLAKKVMNI
jgi:hypothetical protein